MRKIVEVGTKGADIIVQLPMPVYEFYKAFARYRNEEIQDCLRNILIEDIDGFADDKGRQLIIGFFGLEEYSTIPVKR